MAAFGPSFPLAEPLFTPSGVSDHVCRHPSGRKGRGLYFRLRRGIWPRCKTRRWWELVVDRAGFTGWCVGIMDGPLAINPGVNRALPKSHLRPGKGPKTPNDDNDAFCHMLASWTTHPECGIAHGDEANTHTRYRCHAQLNCLGAKGSLRAPSCADRGR